MNEICSMRSQLGPKSAHTSVDYSVQNLDSWTSCGRAEEVCKCAQDQQKTNNNAKEQKKKSNSTSATTHSQQYHMPNTQVNKHLYTYTIKNPIANLKTKNAEPCQNNTRVVKTPVNTSVNETSKNTSKNPRTSHERTLVPKIINGTLSKTHM